MRLGLTPQLTDLHPEGSRQVAAEGGLQEPVLRLSMFSTKHAAVSLTYADVPGPFFFSNELYRNYSLTPH